MRAKNYCVMAILLAGIICITYGVTRYIVTQNIINKCELCFSDYKLNESAKHKEAFTLSDEFKDLESKICLSGGAYKWRDGLLVTVGIGMSIILIYIFVLQRTK